VRPKSEPAVIRVSLAAAAAGRRRGIGRMAGHHWSSSRHRPRGWPPLVIIEAPVAFCTFLLWTKAATGSAPSLRSPLTSSSHTLSMAWRGLISGMSIRTVDGNCSTPLPLSSLASSYHQWQALPTKLTQLAERTTAAARRADDYSSSPSGRLQQLTEQTTAASRRVAN
jgi:hypothetical protein